MMPKRGLSLLSGEWEASGESFAVILVARDFSEASVWKVHRKFASWKWLLTVAPYLHKVGPDNLRF
ncbi:MAG: hypothetical protein OSA89_11905 [Mariniblastus sp.]|nr:hypothetical protein [Mariniblastus sp.]